MNWKFFLFLVIITALVMGGFPANASDFPLPDASAFFEQEVSSKVTPEVTKFVLALGGIAAFSALMFR